jgi:hypothetical protein
MWLTQATSRRLVQECYNLGSLTCTCDDYYSYYIHRVEKKRDNFAAACASKVNAPLGVRRLVRLGLGSSCLVESVSRDQTTRAVTGTCKLLQLYHNLY